MPLPTEPDIEGQGFGQGLPVQVTDTVEDVVTFSPRVLPMSGPIGIGGPGGGQITNADNPGTQQIPQSNAEDQTFGFGLPRNVNVG